MEAPADDSLDGSSIKPVSSLRSHFENMTGSSPATPSPLSASREASPSSRSQPDHVKARADESRGRISLDSSGRDPSWALQGSATEATHRGGLAPPGQGSLRAPSQGGPPAPPRQRPLSMGPMSPPRSGPVVTVEAPRSPSRPTVGSAAVASPLSRVGDLSRPSTSQESKPSSRLFGLHFDAPARASTPPVDPRKSPFLSPTEVEGLPKEDLSLSEGGRKQSPAKVPPPVNRADKPKPRPLPPASTLAVDMPPLKSLAPTQPDVNERVSPFSTPPSSDEDSRSDGNPLSAKFGPFQDVGSAPARTSPRQEYFDPPPVHHSVVNRRRDQGARIVSAPHRGPKGRITSATQATTASHNLPHDLPNDPPGLPPRPAAGTNDDAHPHARSHAKSTPIPPRSAHVRSQPVGSIADAISGYAPPPKRAIPSSGSKHDYGAVSRSGTQAPEPANVDRGPEPPSGYRQSFQSSRTMSDQSNETSSAANGAVPSSNEYPDSSQANRRKPRFRRGPSEIPTKYDTRLFCVSGEYVCTTGHMTRAWSLETGEQVMSLNHGETVKVTSIAFKPAMNLEDEGTRIWLGTNTGELQEVDIPTQTVVFAKASAHPRREVIKILRHGSEMWTLDDEGKLHVWPADETGTPNLRFSHHSFRVPRGHSFSLIVTGQLWLATGKEIRVFHPSSDPGTAFQVLARPLGQPGVSEVTSGATIGSRPDKVFFGHTDGKVTIYSRDDYACLGVVNVSLYKINSLTGVGDFMWAGFNTGMLYVYDTSTTPWTVKKDWHAHESPVVNISVDRSSIWKLDRLQVASLGADNHIRVWDGMLQDDWLENAMQERDVEFCSFREIRALVMTWNAGASKPESLRRDEQDDNFFRELLGQDEPPELLVFGFQELVDLEDKKVTAKSFFKGSKKKDSYDQEHMSRQYREWRDFLTRCVDLYMPVEEPYRLLHTSSMVGLFTCVFVKASQQIRNVSSSEVKRGMGGLHGNKGALIVRFTLDDSSLCFVNCHLAAGQTQTVQRNNDVAAIMEAVILPAERDPAVRADMYVGGGDGSMILDHEICILNGDLNYRIDTMSRDTVVNAVRTNNIAKLLERDQLLLSQKRNPGFRLRAFKESAITFAPTYKYDVGSDKYDSSEKRRSPAWCDRVLYRGLGRIKPLDYRRHEVRVSDHRPVTASFKIRVKTISPKERAAAWEGCQRSFEEVKRGMAMEAKLDFLVNVCGFGADEAKKLLRSQAQRQTDHVTVGDERGKLNEVVTILQEQARRSTSIR